MGRQRTYTQSISRDIRQYRSSVGMAVDDAAPEQDGDEKDDAKYDENEMVIVDDTTAPQIDGKKSQNADPSAPREREGSINYKVYHTRQEPEHPAADMAMFRADPTWQKLDQLISKMTVLERGLQKHAREMAEWNKVWKRQDEEEAEKRARQWDAHREKQRLKVERDKERNERNKQNSAACGEEKLRDDEDSISEDTKRRTVLPSFHGDVVDDSMIAFFDQQEQAAKLKKQIQTQIDEATEEEEELPDSNASSIDTDEMQRQL